MDLKEYPWIIRVKRLILSDNTGDWCRLAYPGHKNGCPNYNRSDRCPPRCPHIKDYINADAPMYLVHSEFDLASHVERLREKHPDWSERRLRCVLYWQGTSRKQLKRRTAEAIKILMTDRTTYCPEGMGVNIFATARSSGLVLERTRDIRICRHVSMIGYSK